MAFDGAKTLVTELGIWAIDVTALTFKMHHKSNTAGNIFMVNGVKNFCRVKMGTGSYKGNRTCESSYTTGPVNLVAIIDDYIESLMFTPKLLDSFPNSKAIQWFIEKILIKTPIAIIV